VKGGCRREFSSFMAKEIDIAMFDSELINVFI